MCDGLCTHTNTGRLEAKCASLTPLTEMAPFGRLQSELLTPPHEQYLHSQNLVSVTKGKNEKNDTNRTKRENVFIDDLEKRSREPKWEIGNSDLI